MRFLNVFALCISIFALSACSEIELASHFGKKLTGDEIQSKGKYKVGNSYTIKGKRYHPVVDYRYNETGIASWYGPGFHGKTTANGERFDENELTAAHKTLPLPSIVRVTNLENGKSLIVRVNDRGPYAHGRIIDMSKKSAELLGFRNQGTAKVRVEVMEAESRMVAKAAQEGRSTNGVEVAMNRPGYKSPNIVYKTPQPASTAPATIQQASLETPQRTVPGHITNGNFYPDAMVTENAVTQKQLYIQLASLSSRESAMKFATGLNSYGRPLIQEAVVDGAQYYRVRVSASSIPEADAILERVMADGYKTALIVVD